MSDIYVETLPRVGESLDENGNVVLSPDEVRQLMFWLERLQTRLRQDNSVTNAIAEGAVSQSFTLSLTPTVSVSGNSVDNETFTSSDDADIANITSSMNLSIISDPTSGNTQAISALAGDGEITITFFNSTAGSDTPDAGDYVILAVG